MYCNLKLQVPVYEDNNCTLDYIFFEIYMILFGIANVLELTF